VERHGGAGLGPAWHGEARHGEARQGKVPMGISQRRKGAGYEREICLILREALGVNAQRNLDQTRDGGGDIALGPYLIECKRRKRISFYDWLDQAKAAANGKTPVVVARADERENVIIMRLIDFLPLIVGKV
jgi:hypothetical protein